MRRKRRSPAPSFKQPAPYNPITGKYAALGESGVLTRAAMMQVIEADTHDNYVVCRGYDPETQRFHDSLSVAKPYGARGTNPYVVGQMFAAIKPRTRIGDTSGVSATTTGHPADLAEVINILVDDDGKDVAWLLIDPEAGSAARWGKLDATVTAGNTVAVSLWQKTGGGWDGWDEDSTENETAYAMPQLRCTLAIDTWVLIELINGRWVITEHDYQARWIEFTVNDATGFTYTDSSVTVDGVTYHDGFPPTTAITTVYNVAESGGNYQYAGSNNDKGTAIYDDDGKYYIISMDKASQARWIKFSVNDGTGFTTADASVVVDGVSYYDGFEPDTAVTTVYTNNQWMGDDDDVGYALHDPADNKYYAIFIEHKAVTSMTDFQVDGANQKLQEKTTALRVPGKATQSGWTDIHTGTECT